MEELLAAQETANYTVNGQINCDPKKNSLPTCINGMSTRFYEKIPFDGTGACVDVMRTMSATDGEWLAEVMDTECQEEAEMIWPLSPVGMNYTGSYGAIDQRLEHRVADIVEMQDKLNYTTLTTTTVYECAVYSESTGLFSMELLSPEDVGMAVESTCSKKQLEIRTINCDRDKKAEPNCLDRKANRNYANMPFTGEDACGDVIRTMSMTSTESIRIRDAECAPAREQGHPLDWNKEACDQRHSLTYHLWFKGHILVLGQGLDYVIRNNHLFNASQQQFMNFTTWYYERPGWPLWFRPKVTDGNWFDTAQNLHLCSCTSQTPTSLHVEGYIRGDFLAYSRVSFIDPSNSCTIGTKRPLGAPPGGPLMYGVISPVDCVVNIHFDGHNSSVPMISTAQNDDV